jgi:hypothetical protein
MTCTALDNNCRDDDNCRAKHVLTLRNRVTPFGEIVAVPARGTLLGNRGVLHNAERTLVRDTHVKRWIACRLEFRGRYRTIMTPGRWTELFFLDEATAFAAGHRPCAECRNADYKAFQAAWRRAYPDESIAADAMDSKLHAERRIHRWLKRTHVASAGETLPEGTFVALDERAWLVWQDQLLGWTAEGYDERRPRHSGAISVLTPVSVVGVLQAGYQVQVHPSATQV